jgi:hypothetical protein
MRAHLFFRLASLAGAIAAVPTLTSAQLAGRVVVTPYVGAYLPTDHVARIGRTPDGTMFTADAKQQTAMAFGANVSFWLTDHLAIEGGSAYSASGLRSTMALDEPAGLASAGQKENAHIWLGSVKVMMQLLPDESAFNLRFGVGPAIISHGGSAYAGNADGKLSGLTDYGAAMSLCTRISLMDNVALRLRGENYMYYSKMGWKSNIDPTREFSFDSRMQHDFVLSAGLQLFLNP